MNSARRKTIDGRIVLIQETRFQILTEAGRSYLFTLAHNSKGTIEDLIRWQATGRRVQVDFQGQPNFGSGIAHTVAPAPPPP